MVNITPRFWRKKLLTMKTEVSYGVDPTPTAAANAILAQNLSIRPLAGDYITRAIERGILGAQPRVPVGTHAALSFEVELQGRGAAQDAVPAWDAAIQACRMGQTVNNATSIQASPATSIGSPTGSFTYVADAAYAGTTPRRVTLLCTTAGGSGTAEFTVSAPAGFGADAASTAGQVMTDATEFPLVGSASITPTVVDAFEVGDKFTIDLLPKNVTYKPVDTEGASAYAYLQIDGHQHKIAGIRGNVQYVYERANFPRLRFDMLGIFNDPTATALETGTFTAWQTPRPLSPAYVPFFNLHEYEAALRSLTVNLGNQVSFRSLINEEKVSAGDREGAGSVSIKSPLLSTKNFFSAVIDQDLGRADLWHGTAAGLITALQLPNVQLTNPVEESDGGEIFLNMDMHVLPLVAADDLILRVM